MIKKYFAVGFLTLALLFAVAPVAQAQTNTGGLTEAQTQALIQQLQAQIVSLTAQIQAIIQNQNKNVSEASDNSNSSGSLAIGSRVRVVLDGEDDSWIRVRETGSLSGRILGRVTAGYQGTITSNPISQGGHTWWKVDFDRNPDGWISGQFLARVGDATSQTPTINSVSGPTSLGVSQTGTWRVNVSAPSDAYIEYIVAWGEEDGYAGISSVGNAITNYTGVFTHSYSNPGTYTVRFRIRDKLGRESQVSLTVRVNSSTTQTPMITVTSPVAGSTYSLPTATIPFSWTWSGVNTSSITPVMRLLDQNGKEVYGKLGSAGGLSYSSQGGSGIIPAPINLVIPTGQAQYRVQICTSLNSSSCVTGGYFTINKTTSSSLDLYPDASITMITPRSGENLQSGTQYTIKWTNSGLPTNATQYIMITNGIRGTIEDPNSTIVAGLPSTATSYTWTVAPNTGWGIGMKSVGQKIASFLGIKTVLADTNQYVIGVGARVPGVVGDIAWGKSAPFTVANPTTITAPAIFPEIQIQNNQSQWINRSTSKTVHWGYLISSGTFTSTLKFKVGLYSDLNGGIWGNNVLVPVSMYGKNYTQSTVITPNISSDLFNKDYYIRVQLVNADGTDYRYNGARVEARSNETFQVVASSGQTNDPLPPTTGPNLVINGDFAQSFYGWFLAGNGYKESIIEKDALVVSNDGSNSPDYRLYQQTINVRPGATYEYGAAINANFGPLTGSMTSNICYVDVYHYPGVSLETGKVAARASTNDWRWLNSRVTIPAGMTNVQIRLIAGYALNGTCRFDDVYLKEVSNNQASQANLNQTANAFTSLKALIDAWR